MTLPFLDLSLTFRCISLPFTAFPWPYTDLSLTFHCLFLTFKVMSFTSLPVRHWDEFLSGKRNHLFCSAVTAPTPGGEKARDLL